MNSSATDNPYAAPSAKSDARPAQQPSPPAGWRVPLLILFTICGLLFAFSVFWFGMAVYELATLKPDDYGPHTWRFRNGYLKGLAMSVLLGIVSFCVCRWSLRKARS